MVPKGWTKTPFGEHIDLLNGFAFKSALYSDDESDIKLLRGDNIEPNKLRWRNVKRWSKDDYESLEKYHLKVNDFIIAMDRTWITAGLKVAEVKQEDLPCLLVQRVSRIRSLPTLCQDIIKHHFSSYRFEQYVKSVQTETAVPHISSTQINEFNLLLPPLQEQQKIAKILSTWDKTISTTERLIENSTQQKKALMQQLLTGKKRLLDESGKRFEVEWEELKLENVFKLSSGDTKPKDVENEPTEEQKIPVFGGNNIMGYSANSNSEGDVILIGRVGEYCGVTRLIQEKCWITDNALFTKEFSDEFDKLFIVYLLQNFQLSRLRNKGGQPQISQKPIYTLKLKIPLLKEQRKIATVLTNADKEIELLEQQLADLQQEKKALMQVLLTGKKRVVV